MRSPPPQTRAQAEAAEWFARLGNRSVTTQALRDFRGWREDPANDAAYQAVETYWQASGEHAGDPELMRLTADALGRGKRNPFALMRSRTAAWALPAGGLAIALLVMAAVNALSPTYSTGPAEQRVVRLADGSRLHLNVASRVRVDYSKGERRLLLTQGEAFFEVAHNAARPFIVVADGARVRAVGTKFDVRRDDGRVQVTLLEGRVQVARDTGSQAWMLTPDQQLTVTPRGVARAPADAARTASWTTGRLIFHQTPLSAAIADVNRYGAHKVEVSDPQTAQRLLNGVFDVGDTDAFVKGVCSVLDLQATTGPDGAIHLAPDVGAGPAG